MKRANIPVETCLETFCESLEAEPQPSFCELLDDSLTDLDLGERRPVDPPVCDESSLSSCHMWNDGSSFLDNLLEDLIYLPSSSDDSLCDLSSSSSDDSFCDLSSSADDSLYDLLSDMSMDEWTPQDSCFDLDDFVT